MGGGVIRKTRFCGVVKAWSYSLFVTTWYVLGPVISLSLSLSMGINEFPSILEGIFMFHSSRFVTQWMN